MRRLRGADRSATPIPMRVLITGGAGFIGSHLARRLLGEGRAVVVLDNLSTGSLDNLRDLEERPDFECVVGSATDSALVDELSARCDFTAHLAAAVGVRLILDKPVETILTNVQATEIVLRAAARTGRPVLVASTSEVYGKSDTLPFREEHDLVLGPTFKSRWAYACSKAMDEWLAFAYHREHGVPVVICRIFNTVGPGQTGRYGMVLPNFARQALAGEPITVYGSGEQTRCFTHVQDTVEALVRLMAEPAALGEVVNVGSDHEVSIRRLAELTRKTAGSESEIVRVPYTEAYEEGFEDMLRRAPDVSKLERLIGFRPRTGIESIVADVVDSLRSPA